MRVASRVIGALLVIGGFGPFAILGYVTLKEGWQGATVATWAAIALFLAAGIGLTLGGKYYLRLDPDAPDEVEPASAPTEFLVIHRRQLKVIAQVGLALSAIRLGSACFGIGWPGRWADWPLLLFLIGILFVGRRVASPNVRDNSDWMRVPGWIRDSLPRVYGTALWGGLLLIVFGQWSRFWVSLPMVESLPQSPIYRLIIRLLYLAFMTTLYGVEVLFFTYGELRPKPEG